MRTRVFAWVAELPMPMLFAASEVITPEPDPGPWRGPINAKALAAAPVSMSVNSRERVTKTFIY